MKDLLEDESTRATVIALLIAVFKDEELARVTGKFALEASGAQDSRRMLDAQTARLVSAIVLDKQVQADAGVGIGTALKYALLPGYGWLFPRAAGGAGPS